MLPESSAVEVCIVMKTDEEGSEVVELSSRNKVYVATKLEKKAHFGNLM